MATPARARLRRGLIGLMALVAAVGGAVALGPAPASAVPVLAVASSPGTLDLKVGGDAQSLSVNVTVTEPVGNAKVDISVPLTDAGVTITGTSGASCPAGDGGTLHCDLGPMAPNQAKAITVTVQPPQQSDLQPGKSHTGQGAVQVSADGAQPVSGGYTLTLTNDAPNSVGNISGSVVDEASGKPVSGATITISDTASHNSTVTTGDDGNFTWAPSNGQVLVPGQITVKVTADGFKDRSDKQTGTAGQPLVFGDLHLDKVAKPHSNKPKATTPPPSTAVAAAPKDSGGLGVVTWLLIILGSLLVIGGVIAIILLLRKKDDGDGDDDGGDDGQGPLLPFDSPRPGYRDDSAATTVMAPVGANGLPVGDATVAHNGPLVRDEYDDYDNFARNYGTNNYQAGGQPYAGETQQYGGGQSQPYAGETQQHSGPPSSQPYGGETQQYSGPPSGGNQPYSGPPSSQPYSGPPSSNQQYSGPPAGQDQIYSAPPSTSGPPQQNQQYGGQQQGGQRQYGESTQPWQQSDSDRSEGTMYGGRGTYGRGGQPAPTSGAAPTSGYPGQPAGGTGHHQPQYGQPTSGAAPTSGYQQPGQYGQQPGGAPTSGPAYPGGNYGGDQGAPGQYGQPPANRPAVDDPTRTWQPNQQPPQRQQPPPPPRSNRPGGDETRLDRADGVDWLDG